MYTEFCEWTIRHYPAVTDKTLSFMWINKTNIFWEWLLNR